MITGATQRIDKEVHELNDAVTGLRLEINTLSTGVGLLKWMIPAGLLAASVIGPIMQKVL